MTVYLLYYLSIRSLFLSFHIDTYISCLYIYVCVYVFDEREFLYFVYPSLSPCIHERGEEGNGIFSKATERLRKDIEMQDSSR